MNDAEPCRPEPQSTLAEGESVSSFERFSAAVRAELATAAETLDQFEEAIVDWQKRFRRAQAMAQYEERRFRETGLITARRQIGYVAAGTSIRLVDLASGLVSLINTRHGHAAFAVARAIIETASVPAYARRHVVPRLAKSRASQVEEILRRLALGVDPGVETDRERRIDPIRVAQLVKALGDEADEFLASNPDEPGSAGRTMRSFYSIVTDHAHPNFSAQHLSSTLGRDGMAWARATASI